MIDFATFMKRYQRVIHQPPAGRPRWINEGGRINELLYLSWGWREYGRHAIPISLHEGWTYQLVTEGQALLDTGEKRIPVPGRHLIVIGPSCPNGWQAAQRSDRCRIFTWIWRDAPLLESMSPKEDGWRLFALSAEEERQLQALHEETRAEISRPDETAVPAIHAIRARVDVVLARSETRLKTEPGAKARLEYALSWLSKHPEDLRPVTGLAEYLQVSPATLNRLFQKELGRNVREVAYAMRMEAAREILERDGPPVKELAFRLGYSHANDFTRAYSRYWRRGPSGRSA